MTRLSRRHVPREQCEICTRTDGPIVPGQRIAICKGCFRAGSMLFPKQAMTTATAIALRHRVAAGEFNTKARSIWRRVRRALWRFIRN